MLINYIVFSVVYGLFLVVSQFIGIYEYCYIFFGIVGWGYKVIKKDLRRVQVEFFKEFDKIFIVVSIEGCDVFL